MLDRVSLYVPFTWANQIVMPLVYIAHVVFRKRFTGLTRSVASAADRGWLRLLNRAHTEPGPEPFHPLLEPSWVVARSLVPDLPDDLDQRAEADRLSEVGGCPSRQRALAVARYCQRGHCPLRTQAGLRPRSRRARKTRLNPRSAVAPPPA